MSNGISDTPVSPLSSYLDLLKGSPDPSRFLDLRWRRPGGAMRRRFLSSVRTQSAAQLITRLAGENDVYVGVALRDGQVHGGRAAISCSHVVWVESDDPRTAQRLGAFRSPPTMVIASGTPGHMQLYWLLDRAHPIEEIERANRRLAIALAGDVACADGARILRLPDTLNHKHDPPRAVTLLVLRRNTGLSLAGLTAGLREDQHRRTSQHSRAAPRLARGVNSALLDIPAAQYVHALTGRSPNREGKVRCPFHDDRDPSLQLYADGGFYCFGSSCRKGGTIFDFAGYLWDIVPRGAGFIELRSRLAQRFD
ncbi:MAG: CHC2 zinc finger domain-containing protein [Solirubrobacteraceae bacterium]